MCCVYATIAVGRTVTQSQPNKQSSMPLVRDDIFFYLAVFRRCRCGDDDDELTIRNSTQMKLRFFTRDRIRQRKHPTAHI